MPLYEYECEKCGHQFDQIVKFDADPPPCPECEGKTKKKVSQSSFQLKGGGWAKDGY